jgi:hypothetical protein
VAVWFDRHTLTPRRERVMQVDMLPLKGLIERVKDENYDITREEAQQLLSANEIAVAVFLKSWTLRLEDGSPRPIPATADEVLDLDRELYDALVAQSAKLLVQSNLDDFSVDAVEDSSSPTGD